MSHGSATSLGDLLASIRERLAAAPFAVSPREALLLLSRVLERSEAQILADDDGELGEADLESIEELVSRRLRGEPIAYLFRDREFYGRSFFVDPRVLIPRPETEHLVEAILEMDLPPGASVLDVGTGSGCIAVTLALEQELRVHAMDTSFDALQVAKLNAMRHGAKVSLTACDLISAVAEGSFDLVTANLPYVADDERAQLSVEITDFEPRSALFAEDGLSAFRRFFSQIGGWRSRPKALVLEIGSTQAKDVAEIAARQGFCRLRTLKDYSDHDRVLILQE